MHGLNADSDRIVRLDCQLTELSVAFKVVRSAERYGWIDPESLVDHVAEIGELVAVIKSGIPTLTTRVFIRDDRIILSPDSLQTFLVCSKVREHCLRGYPSCLRPCHQKVEYFVNDCILIEHVGSSKEQRQEIIAVSDRALSFTRSPLSDICSNYFSQNEPIFIGCLFQVCEASINAHQFIACMPKWI